MKPEQADVLEESYASWLVACDEALVAGSLSPELSGVLAPPELRPRLQRGLACLKFLEEVWPRRRADDPDRTPSGQAATTALPPAQLGRFAIRRELGRGGYGVVFLAYDPQLGREVALKVPRTDVLVTAELRQRFYHEARAAAGLDHPNLVPVYEAGEEGLVCYIASAYCPGITLAQWLKDQTGPVHERTAAQLVVSLADGVQHAHSRGVLHRDLKPGNILLEGNPEAEAEANTLSGLIPKITDFGLAKRLLEGTAQTRSGDIVGTPAYMAPEQAEGKSHEVGTAADVYALGAMLYELLTGQSPFQAPTVLAMLDQVRTQEPLAPHRLRPGVSRDLETICLKCLRKEPGRRYASAHALADDLRRFLAGEPVQARPVGELERFRLWCKRKPGLAALSATLALAVVAGFAAVAWQWRRADLNARDAAAERDHAEASRRKAHQTIDEYFTQVSEHKLLGKPGLQPLRKALLERALGYYQDFLRERGDDPTLQADVAATYFRVAVIHDQMGSKDAARSALQEALTLYEQLTQADPLNTAARAGLARTCNQLGDLHARMNALDRALDCLDRARTFLEQLEADNPDSPDFLSELARAHRHVATVQAKRDQRAAALDSFGRSTAIGRRLTRTCPERQEFRLDLASTFNDQGDLHTLAGHWQEAIHAFGQGRDLLQPLVTAHPTDPELRSKLVDNQAKVANVHNRSGRLDLALPAWQQVRDDRERLALENPAVIDFQSDLAIAYSFLGKQYSQCKEFPQALACWEQAFHVVEKLLRINPSFPDYRSRRADLHNDRGHVYSKMSRQADALESFEKARAILEELVHDCPDTAVYLHALAINRHNCGNELRQAGRREEARQALDRSYELCRQLIAADPSVLAYPFLLVHVCTRLGELHKDAKELDQAARWHRQALEVCSTLHRSQPQVPDYERLLAACYGNLGEWAQAADRPAEADTFLRQALEIRERLARIHGTLTDVLQQAAQACLDLAALLRETRRCSEALAFYERSRDFCTKALQANPLDLKAESIQGDVSDGRGLVLAQMGRREEALQAHRQAVDVQRKVVARAPEQILYRERLGRHYEHLAGLYRALDRPAEAEAVSREYQQLREQQKAGARP